MPVQLILVAGARPNFMKVAPLWRQLEQEPGFRTTLVHTGQHFDDVMSGQFFRELGLPHPDYHLGAGGGSHAQQTAEIMKRIEPVFMENKPHGVVVVGDVNSTVAAALVAKKMGIDVIHAEAGLRSFDRTMPEEINRVVTDAISDLLLVTEQSGRTNLEREGVDPQRIHMVGNLMIDSLLQHRQNALQSDVVSRLGLSGRPFGLVTLHRPANVDNDDQLAEILRALGAISLQLPLIWPVHPRARAKLEAGSVKLPTGIQVTDPLGYLDFLCLQASSATVFTDSGGIQEETTVLGVPCLTLRENTERPVTIESGTNRLAGTRAESILAAWQASQANPQTGQMPPLWDGEAGKRCVAALKQHFQGRVEVL